VLVFDPKGYMSGNLMLTAAKLFGSHVESSIIKSIKNTPENVSFESFKDLKGEPFLSLVYKVMKKKDSFKNIVSNRMYKDSDFKVPYISEFEYQYFSTLAGSSVHWESILSTETHKIFYSKTNFISNSVVFINGINLMIQTITSEPLEKLLLVFFSDERKSKLDASPFKPANKSVVKSDTKELENHFPSFLVKEHRYTTFPVKTGRFLSWADSIKIDEKKIQGLSRPYTGDLEKIEDFNKKFKFKVVDEKSKEMEIDGVRGAKAQYIEIEKIDEKHYRISHVLVLDPRLIIQPGKTAFKIMLQLFSKNIFKAMEKEFKSIPDDFSFSTSSFDESEPMLNLIKEYFETNKYLMRMDSNLNLVRTESDLTSQ
jgi:hypothetical protein